MATIAGHLFEETPTGRRCTGNRYPEHVPCMRRWVDIRRCTEAHLEELTGYAHTGQLTRNELDQIIVEAKREEAATWLAVVDAASAGSR